MSTILEMLRSGSISPQEADRLWLAQREQLAPKSEAERLAEARLAVCRECPEYLAEKMCCKLMDGPEQSPCRLRNYARRPLAVCPAQPPRWNPVAD
jgi:hypothetical protein